MLFQIHLNSCVLAFLLSVKYFEVNVKINKTETKQDRVGCFSFFLLRGWKMGGSLHEIAQLSKYS